MPTINPYLDAAQTINFGRPDLARLEQLDGEGLRAYIFECVEARDRLVARYSWAIPNDDALVVLATHAPLIEMGAGTGYWAHLLRQRDVDILAFDNDPPTSAQHRNEWHRNQYVVGTSWTEVQQGTPVILRGEAYAGRTLFLCWPPPGSMAVRTLRAYAGNTLALVRCCKEENGDDAFYALLDRAWRCEMDVAIPQWDCVQDTLTIWRRAYTKGSDCECHAPRKIGNFV